MRMLDERRQWVDSLTAEQKADLADRTRAFETLRQYAEKDRVRKLTNDISHAEDAAQLQATLVAYGQWLSARHTAGEQEQMHKDFEGMSASQRVDAIRKAVTRENEQAARHLLPED